MLTDYLDVVPASSTSAHIGEPEQDRELLSLILEGMRYRPWHRPTAGCEQTLQASRSGMLVHRPIWMWPEDPRVDIKSLLGHGVVYGRALAQSKVWCYKQLCI